MCTFDLTDGKKLKIKIFEYSPESMKAMRKLSGFDKDFFIK